MPELWTVQARPTEPVRHPYIWCGGGPIMLQKCLRCGILMQEQQGQYCPACADHLYGASTT